MTIGSDFSITVGGDIRHVSGSTVYSVLELHSWLQDLADDSVYSGDDVLDITSPNPSTIDGPRDNLVATRLNLQSTFNIDSETAKYFNFGSIKQDSANVMYSGLKTIGTVVASSPIYVVQNSNKLTKFWPDGHIQIVVLVKNSGSLIDSGNVTAYSRKWGQTYSHFDVNLSAGGESSAALSTDLDSGVVLTEVQASDLSSKVSISFGDTNQDLGNGNGPKLYKGTITLSNSCTLQECYQYLQYVCREDSVVSLNGVPGWRYRKLDASYGELITAPFGTYAGGTLFFARGWWVTGVLSLEGLKYQLTAHDGTVQSPPVPPLERGINITNIVSGSQVIIFDTGTQSIISSTNSSGTSFQWSEVAAGSRTLDYTVMKVGYKPIRITGITVNGSVQGAPIQQVVDRAYSASSGLSFGTTATIDTFLKKFGLGALTTVQNWYNFWIESWISQASLRNKDFPIETNGPNSFSLMNGYEFTSSTDIDKLSRDGMRYVNGSGVVTAIWSGILSLGAADSFTAKFQQVLGATPIKANKTGVIDQLIQVYGDSTHGDFDYRNYLLIKMQPNQYEPAEVNVISLYGALEDQFYIISMEPKLIPDMPAGDPGVTGVSIINHGASPVTWNAGNGNKQYSITILDEGNNDDEQIHSFINYKLSLDAPFGGIDPFNWPELIVDTSGTFYETKRGEVIGTAGALLKGCRVIRTGGVPHPYFSRFQADDGTYGEPLKTTGLTITNLIAGSTVYIFETGTQTVISSTTNSGTEFTWSETYVSDRGVDYTVIKAGYTPIRVVNSIVSDSIKSVSVQYSEEREYELSTGLTFGVNFSANPSTKKITVSALTSVRNLYSALTEAWRDQSSLRNVAFPITSDGFSTYTFNDSWEFTDSTTISFLSKGGFRYVVAGVEKAVYCAIQTSTLPANSKIWKLQVDGGSWSLLSTGTGFDGCIQTYGDITHGNFDYRGFFALKATNDGFTLGEVDLINDLGNTQIVDTFYFAPLSITETGEPIGNPGALDIVVNNIPNNTSWNGITVGQEVVVGDGISGSDVLRYLTWQRHQGNLLGYGQLMMPLGSSYKSVRGRLYDGAPLEIEGCRVVMKSDGVTPYPDFVLFEGNGTGTYEPPALAYARVNNIFPGSRLFILNTTTNTVLFNGIVAGSTYVQSYYNGTGYTDGDSIEIRLMYVNGLSCKAEFTSNTTAATTGWTVIANQTDCQVYNSYAIDGSSVTEYIADFPNIQIDMNDFDNVWSAKRFYAWYKYTLFTSEGIEKWWGAVTAIDVGNIRINTDIVDLYFDNIKAQSATPSDNIRVFRSDGVYPQATPTSGGGGIGFYATGTVYIAETGVSGLTGAESAKLLGIPDASQNAEAVWIAPMTDRAGRGTAGWFMRKLMSIFMGKSSGHPNSPVFRDINDTRDEVAYTLDSNGNKSSVNDAP